MFCLERVRICFTGDFEYDFEYFELRRDGERYGITNCIKQSKA
jgi:hypothetical protein